jgi:hypothetical protein
MARYDHYHGCNTDHSGGGGGGEGLALFMGTVVAVCILAAIAWYIHWEITNPFP